MESVDVFECSQVLADEKNKKMKISVEHCWNDTDRESPNYSEKDLSQSHRSHQDKPVNETGSLC
jgi:hypothetical protein